MQDRLPLPTTYVLPDEATLIFIVLYILKSSLNVEEITQGIIEAGKGAFEKEKIKVEV